MLTIILLLLTRHFKNKKRRLNATSNLRAIARLPLLGLLLVYFTYSTAQPAAENKEYRTYDVLYKGKALGNVVASREVDGGKVNISLVSDIRFRMLFPITIKSKEQAIFHHEVLTWSAIWREVNGKQKLSQQREKNLRTLSVLSLYFIEPKHIQGIYSDAFEKNIAIKEIETGRYRIDLPDGNYNVYNYEGGVCKSVDVKHSFLHLRFVLKENSIKTGKSR